MIKHKYISIFVISVFLSMMCGSIVRGISQDVLIGDVRLGDVGYASHEFIELYNSSTDDIDVTDWCLYYASSSSNQIGSKMVCFNPVNPNIHLYLPSHGSIFTISNQLATFDQSLGSDFKFSSTLSNSAGHIRLINDDALEIDKIGWGLAAVSAEGGVPSSVPSNGEIIRRKINEFEAPIDTDNNGLDFEIALPKDVYQYNTIYEVEDMCSNIDGFQFNLPDEMEINLGGACVPIDACYNILDIQVSIPPSMVRGNGKNCFPEPQPLEITELMPNLTGIDTNKEYIELYNPNAVAVKLENYKMTFGDDHDSEFLFPPDVIIESHQYLAFYNNEIKFTLLNSTSYVTLKYIDGTDIYTVDTYVDPEDDTAWAMINDVWQYTNRPTPNSLNLVSNIEIKTLTTADGLQPCGINQYRNPDTNRCRNIATVESALIPCSQGQERNPETNRCRSIAAVLGTDNLTPCKPGQERNLETNRCRNIIGSMPKADYAPEEIKKNDINFTLIISISLVCISAVGYAIWEWRSEVINFMYKFLKFMKVKK